MRILRSIGIGLGIALLSTSIVLGSLSLTILEGTLTGKTPVKIEPSTTVTKSTSETIDPGILIPNETPTITSTLPPTPATCPPPAGWVPVTVMPNEDLNLLSARYLTSPDQLIQANCLTSGNPIVGAILYVPPLPTATQIPCGPPSGWIIYIVKPLDNLFQISNLYQTTVPEIQAANCMGTSTLIITGQSLYVPNVATITPGRIASQTPTPSASPVLTLAITSSTVNFSAVGANIDFTYRLSNTGTVTINGPFTVTDSKLSVNCPATSNLTPSASLNCTGSYLSTQGDLDAGSFTVSATGHAFYKGSAIASNPASTSVPAIQNSSLTLDKTSLMSSYVLAGDLISYNYNLKNTGNVTLSGPFTVSDDKTAVACPSTASLAPNTSINCTATYSVTQTDVDNGYVTNNSTGHAIFKGNAVHSNQDSVTINSTIPVGLLTGKNTVIAWLDPSNGISLWILKTFLTTC